MEIKDIEETICATANKLEQTGLKSFTRLDFKTCTEYLASKNVSAKIKSSKYKGYARTYYVTYNEKNFSGSELTSGDKKFGYKIKTESQIELIHTAIQLFKINNGQHESLNMSNNESDPCVHCGKKSYDDYVQRYTYKSHSGFIEHIRLCENCGFEFKQDQKFIKVCDI